ncbi:MAG TPA: tetratricopeptide repeat protein [Pyrinomonadaceae bacterium]|nr:tetratricopeptide repeat protein [Pyrinomonadaceae bacterium]
MNKYKILIAILFCFVAQAEAGYRKALELNPKDESARTKLDSLMAQAVKNPVSPPCPTIKITSDDSIEAKTPIFISVKVSDGDPEVTPTFNWTISAGKIAVGQGTSEIIVETNDLAAPNSVTARVDVGGYDPSCSASKSKTISISDKTEVSEKSDSSSDKSTSNLTTAELLERAKASIEKREYDAAISELTSVINSQPKNDEAYAQRARAYFLKTNNFDLAFADAESALKINSKNVEALNVRGLVKVERKEIDSALADFTSAINIKPDYFKPYLNRAKIFIEKNEFEKAVADYNEVIKFNKNDSYLLFLRGSVYLYSIKNYDLAIKDYTEAVKLNPNSNSSYFSRGQAFSKKSNFNEAIADFNKAIEIDPKDEFSYYFRGNAYNSLNKTEQATADYKKAAELNPKYAPFTLALAEITKKDSDQAGQNTNSGGTSSESRKKFLNLTAEFNALRKIYDQKFDLYSPIADKEYARFNRNIDPAYKKTAEDKSIRTSYCKSLLELDSAITNLQKIAVALNEMDKNGEVAKAVSTQELAAIRDALHKWEMQELYRPTSIIVGDCRANPTNEEVTLDDLVEANKIETRNRIIEILKTLGNLSGYLMAGKNFSSLKTSSTQTEICQVTSEFKKESDKINPLLEEFFKLYIPEPDPTWGGPGEDERTVKFDNPEITKQAEKILEIRTKLFLPGKDQIKNIRNKYGCQ